MLCCECQELWQRARYERYFDKAKEFRRISFFIVNGADVTVKTREDYLYEQGVLRLPMTLTDLLCVCVRENPTPVNDIIRNLVERGAELPFSNPLGPLREHQAAFKQEMVAVKEHRTATVLMTLKKWKICEVSEIVMKK